MKVSIHPLGTGSPTEVQIKLTITQFKMELSISCTARLSHHFPTLTNGAHSLDRH